MYAAETVAKTENSTEGQWWGDLAQASADARQGLLWRGPLDRGENAHDSDHDDLDHQQQNPGGESSRSATSNVNTAPAVTCKYPRAKFPLVRNPHHQQQQCS